MISQVDQHLAQQIVDTVKSVCGHDINFINSRGIIYASTDTLRIGTYHEIAHEVSKTGESIEVQEDNAFLGTRAGINMPIYHNKELLAVIGISGQPDSVRKYAHLAERITLLLIREREVEIYSRTQAEKKHFIIDTLIRNELTHLNYLNALLKEFEVDLTCDKRLVIISINQRCNPANISMLESVIQHFFQSIPLSLYCFYYPNEYLAVIDESKFEKQAYLFKSFAQKHNGLFKVIIGKSVSIFNLSHSYETAKTSLNTISFQDDNYILYDDLILELVLSSMKTSTKQEYMAKTISDLSDKEIQLLDTYFKNNCSLANTCKQLYIHKNTLQYQLNHIYQTCGINPRNFQDAVLLYIAIQLMKYPS